MSAIAIKRYREIGDGRFFAEVESLLDRVKLRASELFELRRACGGIGGELDDWLAAEREILWSPPAELTETDREFHLRIAVPGFEAKDIHVAVTPDSIQVKADAARTAADKLIFSEFGERTLFRSIALPSEIEIEKTRAVLDKGMLLFTAHKAKPAEKEIATAA